MTVKISTQARNGAGDSIVDLIDAGSLLLKPILEIRTGAMPDAPESSATGVLLCTLKFGIPTAFGNFGNGIAIANPMTEDPNVDESGVAGWFRISDRDSVAIMDGNITGAGAGGDLEFDNIEFIKGGVVAISSLVANMPQ